MQINSGEAGSNFYELAEEMKLSVFQFLSAQELSRIATVSKEWNVLTSDPMLWRFFGAQDKNHYLAIRVLENPTQLAQKILAEEMNAAMYDYSAVNTTVVGRQQDKFDAILNNKAKAEKTIEVDSFILSVKSVISATDKISIPNSDLLVLACITDNSEIRPYQLSAMTNRNAKNAPLLLFVVLKEQEATVGVGRKDRVILDSTQSENVFYQEVIKKIRELGSTPQPTQKL